MSLIDRINANPLPFAQLLGIEFMSAEADSLAARMLIRPDLCTIGGIAHGGAIMSFADTLGAAAAFINLPPTQRERRRSKARPISSPARRPARR